jgi:urease accessory protein
MVGAALRLGIIHHYDAQKVIHESKPIISSTIIQNIERPLSGIWQFSPRLEINQIKHERMHSKMFIT